MKIHYILLILLITCFVYAEDIIIESTFEDPCSDGWTFSSEDSNAVAEWKNIGDNEGGCLSLKYYGSDTDNKLVSYSSIVPFGYRGEFIDLSARLKRIQNSGEIAIKVRTSYNAENNNLEEIRSQYRDQNEVCDYLSVVPANSQLVGSWEQFNTTIQLPSNWHKIDPPDQIQIYFILEGQGDVLLDEISLSQHQYDVREFIDKYNWKDDGLVFDSYKSAADWWPAQYKEWTPLGWPGYPFDFVVPYNGCITVDRFTNSSDENLQNFMLWVGVGEVPDFSIRSKPGKYIPQSLLEGYLPELETIYDTNEYTITQTVFAYLSDNNDNYFNGNLDEQNLIALVKFKLAAKTTEPNIVNLWINIGERFDVWPWIQQADENFGDNAIILSQADGFYKEDNYLLSENNKVRLAVIGETEWDYYKKYSPPNDINSCSEWQTLQDSNFLNNILRLELSRADNYELILAVPFRLASQDCINGLAETGYSAIRTETINFWKNKLDSNSIMKIETPEKEINDLYNAGSVLMLMAIENLNDKYVTRTGCLSFEGVWANHYRMDIRHLDIKGFHQATKKLIDFWYDQDTIKERISRELTGNLKDFYENGLMDGYIFPSAGYGGQRWASDSGSATRTIAEHYLLTHDTEFLDKWLPLLLQSCQWVERMRQYTQDSNDPEIYKGILPPFKGTDGAPDLQHMFTDSLTYQGLDAVCKVLEDINHPQKDKWLSERDDYKSCIKAALIQDSNKCPRWIDKNGCEVPFYPMRLGRHWIDTFQFYADTGPHSLIKGVLEPCGDVISDILKYLKEGPNVYRWKDIPTACVIHGLSASEPEMSYNVYADFYGDETDKFIEGFYSLAAGGFSIDTKMPKDFRQGQYIYCTYSTLVEHLRNMLVFEKLNDSTKKLEYLKAVPLLWLEDGKEINIINAPTYFGKTSLHFKSNIAQGKFFVNIVPPSVVLPQEMTVRLHLPDNWRIKNVLIDGEHHNVFQDNLIVLPNTTESMDITVYVVSSVREDLTMLYSQWLDTCGSRDEYCNGSDNNFDRIVNLIDFSILANEL